MAKCKALTGSAVKGLIIADCCVGQVDLTQADESFDIAKPLVVALRELGACTAPVVRILVEAGADFGVDAYTGLSDSQLQNWVLKT